MRPRSAMLALITVGSLVFSSPAAADHINNLDIPFANRGACEAATQTLSNKDYWLLDAFPEVFSNRGDVRSFLNKAFTCEQNESDGQWYITDHRGE